MIGEIGLMIPIRYIVIGYIVCVLLWLIINNNWYIMLFDFTTKCFMIGYGACFLINIIKNKKVPDFPSLIGQIIAFLIALIIILVVSLVLEKCFDSIPLIIFRLKRINRKTIMTAFAIFEELAVTIASAVIIYSYFKANFFDPNEPSFEYFTDRSAFVVMIVALIVVGVKTIVFAIESEDKLSSYIFALLVGHIAQWLVSIVAGFIFGLCALIMGLGAIVCFIIIGIIGGFVLLSNLPIPRELVIADENAKKMGIPEDYCRSFRNAVSIIVQSEREKREHDSSLIGQLSDEGRDELYKLYCDFCDSFPYNSCITFQEYEGIIRDLFRETLSIHPDFVREAQARSLEAVRNSD